MKSVATIGLALLMAGAVLVHAAQAAPAPRAASAEALFRSARVRLAAGTHDQRRSALHELQQAVLLAPDSVRYWKALAAAELESQFSRRARQSYLRVLQLAPRDAEANLGLGLAWKRDWLMYADEPSLEEAIDHLCKATVLDPRRCEAWLALGPLLMERGELAEALHAAECARAADPARGEPLVAAAVIRFRLGQVAGAESLFAAGIPRLPAWMREHLDDITPFLTFETADALQERDADVRAEFAARFWREVDPDPTTPVNEARLEYWARVAHACLLFAGPGDVRWDERSELYARYGSIADLASFVPPMVFDQSPRRLDRRKADRRGNATDAPCVSPVHAGDWTWPGSGMARLLREPLGDTRELPHWMGSADRHPDPRALRRSDLLVIGGGRGLFPALPPGARPLELRGSVARFEGPGGVKLVAQIECPGTPVDSIWAQCVVADSAGAEVARLGRVLSPSGCDPTTLRTGDFSFEVPPGVYGLTLSVHDATGAAGIARSEQLVPAVAAGLAMSDVVVVCGPVGALRMQNEVRLGPNLRNRFRGDEPLIAYFEIYRLATGPDRHSRFEYEYSVEPVDEPPLLVRLLSFAYDWRYQVRAEEENLGPLRRQFITVPMSSFKPGSYRLVVRVKDLRSGRVATGTARFEHVADAPAVTEGE